MQIRTTITQHNHLQFLREYYLRHNLKNRLIWAFVFVALCVLEAISRNAGIWACLLTALIAATVFFIFNTIIPYTLAIADIDKQVANSYNGGLLVDFTTDGLAVLYNGKTEVINRSAIQKTLVTPGYIALRVMEPYAGKHHRRILLLHRSDIQLTAENTPVFNRAVTGTYDQLRGRKLYKVPYAVGVLSLIPFVGGINGVVMIIQGLRKYHSVAYVVLGAMGIFITGIFIYMMATRPKLDDATFRKSETIQVQNDLNNLVKSIEFYKLQYRHYPDSLKQLQKNGLPTINDDLRWMEKKGKTQPYNYKLIGDKYTLFSSGWDEVPYTKDDIYPDIAVDDSSKIGLVIEKR